MADSALDTVEPEREGTNTVYKPSRFKVPWWQALMLGLAAGAGGSLIGVGGGIVMVPFLTIWGMEQKRAQGTSLAVITALVPVAIIIYYFLGNINFSFAVPLATGGVIGGFLGATLCQRYSNRILAKLFGFFLLVIALRMIFMPPLGEIQALNLADNLQYFRSGLFGLLAGLVAGFFGVGGGVVFVPTGVMFAGLPQVVAQGSSFTAMLPTSLAGSIAYRNKRSIDWELVKWMVPGAWMGSFVGSYGADLIPGRTLQLIFAVFLFYTGIRRVIVTNRGSNEPESCRMK